MTALNLPPHAQLFIIAKWKTIKAVHEHNRLRHSVGKCIKRVTACHNVPDVLILLMSQVPVLITDHHMCTPGQPFFSFFFFFNYIHPQSMQSVKHGRLQRRVDSKGDTAQHMGGCEGSSVHTIFICHEVTRECSTWSTKQLGSQILSRLRKWRRSKDVYRNGSFWATGQL